MHYCHGHFTGNISQYIIVKLQIYSVIGQLSYQGMTVILQYVVVELQCKSITVIASILVLSLWEQGNLVACNKQKIKLKYCYGIMIKWSWYFTIKLAIFRILCACELKPPLVLLLSTGWRSPGNRPTLTSTSSTTPWKNSTPWGKRESLRASGHPGSRAALCEWVTLTSTRLLFSLECFIVRFFIMQNQCVPCNKIKIR